MDLQNDILTEDMLAELLNGPSTRAFCETHESIDMNLSAYLNDLLERKHLRKSEVIRNADINETHGYQLFAGTRKASRDKILQLAFAMGCDVRETQRLLKHAGVNDLYVKNRRDAIILFCLDRGLDMHDTDGQLYRLGERTIQSDVS